MNDQKTPAPTAVAIDWEISPQEVARMLADGREFLFLDCRKPHEHETAAVAGTKLAPMQALELHLPELMAWKNQCVIVMCHHGQRSLTVTALLRDKGFSNVRSLAGGIDRWSREIDPSIRRY